MSGFGRNVVWVGLPSVRPGAGVGRPGDEARAPEPGTDPDLDSVRDPGWGSVAAFALVFALASFLGRLTVPGNSQIALVWPSSGVAFVWFVALWAEPRRRGRPRAVSAVLVVAISTTASVGTGASPAIGVPYAVAALVSAWSGAEIFVRWSGSPGGTLVNRRGLRILVFAAAISAALGAIVVGLVSWLSPPVDLETLILWTLRNTTAVVLVGSVGLRWRYDDPRRLALDRPGPIALTVGVTAACAVIVFHPGQSWPLEFLLLAVATSAATLLTVQWTTIYLVGVAAVTISANLLGAGPFALPDRWASAALVQAFLTALAYSTIGLALEHDLRTRDHAEVVAARAAEQEQSELLGSLYAMMTEAVLVVDATGEVTYANAAAQPFLAPGHERGRQRGTGLPPAAYGVIEAALRGESPPPMDVEVAEGARILSLRAQGLTHRGAAQTLVVLTDVTTDRREQRQLKSFAGTLAHDLRAPLASMSAWAQLLEEEVADTATGIDPTPIDRINTSTERMTTLINDVLAFALADDGPVRTQAVALAPLARDVVREQLEADPTTDVAAARIDIDMPHTVHADPTLLRQLLANYIGNALKYTRPGTAPDAQISSQFAEDGFIRIAVQDRGIGLPAGEEDRVFEEFHRAPAHALAYSGTGLGLAICRRIAERHGGRTWASARPGGGACFFATFPGESASPTASTSD